MPTVLRVGPYRFFFFSDEGSEPPHIHIEAAERRAKFWLSPIDLVWSEDLRSGELTELRAILESNQALLLEAWRAHFRL